MRLTENVVLTIKRRIKSTPWLYHLGAPVRAWQIEQRYSRVVRHYSGRKTPGAPYGLLQTRSGDRLERLCQLTRPLRVFYMGTDYFQDSSGILQALGKVGTLSHFTQGNDQYGQLLGGRILSPSLRVSNATRLWKLFESLEAQQRIPDLLLGQMWAQFLEPSVLSRIRARFGTFVINISMDDRHAYWGPRVEYNRTGTWGLIPHIDLALTAAPECVQWYLKEGCPAFYFPEASDPEIFRPMPDLPKVHDACFVGMRYGIRGEIVKRLRDAGVQVVARGSGWDDGRLATEDTPRLFAQSKIVLGVGTVSHCRDFYALKMRDFDAPMSGSFYLTHDNEDLRGLYDIGREIAVYRTPEDCVEQVRYHLAHEEEREAVARRGLARARESHTWDRRFDQLFHVLGLKAVSVSI